MKRILLDTQALLWWLSDAEELGPKSRRLIASDRPVVSPVVPWEIAIKSGLGKLVADVSDISSAVAAEGFERIGLSDLNMIELAALPHHHRDPFDRLLIAQGRCEDIPILTSDRKFALYDVAVLDART